MYFTSLAPLPILFNDELRLTLLFFYYFLFFFSQRLFPCCFLVGLLLLGICLL